MELLLPDPSSALRLLGTALRLRAAWEHLLDQHLGGSSGAEPGERDAAKLRRGLLEFLQEKVSFGGDLVGSRWDWLSSVGLGWGLVGFLGCFVGFSWGLVEVLMGLVVV